MARRTLGFIHRQSSLCSPLHDARAFLFTPFTLAIVFVVLATATGCSSEVTLVSSQGPRCSVGHFEKSWGDYQWWVDGEACPDGMACNGSYCYDAALAPKPYIPKDKPAPPPIPTSEDPNCVTSEPITGLSVVLACDERRRIIGTLGDWGAQHRHTLSSDDDGAACPLKVTFKSDVPVRVCASPACETGPVRELYCDGHLQDPAAQPSCCLDTHTAKTLAWTCDDDRGNAVLTVGHDGLAECSENPTRYVLDITR